MAFVEQLLDSDGQVPLEPVAADALQAERARALAKCPAPDKEAQREAQRVAREKQLRRRFEAQLAPLAKGAQQLLELPRSLNAYERAMAHEVAEQLKLMHESKGLRHAFSPKTSASKGGYWCKNAAKRLVLSGLRVDVHQVKAASAVSTSGAQMRPRRRRRRRRPARRPWRPSRAARRP